MLRFSRDRIVSRQLFPHDSRDVARENFSQHFLPPSLSSLFPFAPPPSNHVKSIYGPRCTTQLTRSFFTSWSDVLFFNGSQTFVFVGNLFKIFEQRSIYHAGHEKTTVYILKRHVFEYRRVSYRCDFALRFRRIVWYNYKKRKKTIHVQTNCFFFFLYQRYEVALLIFLCWHHEYGAETALWRANDRGYQTWFTVCINLAALFNGKSRRKSSE